MAGGLDWQTDGPTWPNATFSRFVEIGGYRWHVQRSGAGAQALLLHGTGASTHSWAGLLPRLSQRLDVLAVDLPGHAFTRATARSDPSVAGMARDLTRLLHAESFQPAILVGHSAGAALAVKLAMALSRRPQHVVALNGALRPFGGAAAWIAPLVARSLAINPFVVRALAQRGRDASRVARLIAGTGSHPSAVYLEGYQRLFSDHRHVRGTLSMMAAWDVTGLIVPFLETGIAFHLITGSEDRAVPPEDADRLARRYPAITVQCLPGLGHLAHEEDSGQVAEAILAATVQSGKAPRRASL